ncbi:U3 small nucleolar ribonucleoprotein complex, subunit Mpp10 [Cryomyces antarcticus]
MAPFSFSPTTSIYSHTLSAHSVQHPMASPTNTPSALLSALASSPHVFLQPPPVLHTAALDLAKAVLDPLAAAVSQSQLQRQREARKKRKRGQDGYEEEKVLGLKKLHVEGFGVESVWEQARRVLDAARIEVERALPEIGQDTTTNGTRDGDGDDGDEEDEESLGEEDVDREYERDDVDERKELEHASDEDEEDVTLADGDDIDMVEDNFDEDKSNDEEPAEEFVPDPNGLNDGFFSIDDFNRQSEFLEQQDARGDPNDGAASDEEEIDWDADPMSLKPHAIGDDGEAEVEGDEDEDEGDGPTFGNVDLNAPEGASDDGSDNAFLDEGEMDGIGGVGNTNNVLYADFFAPPARKASKNMKKRGRPNSHNFPAVQNPPDGTADAEDDEQDVERTISAVHRDLFEDDASANDSDDALSDLDPSDPRSRRSTHERRQAKLAEEIRRLEAANVAKREWTLAGEARAADRPLNSLLEEDLEFERAGKPVPVITAEVSESIEALIKRRILAQDFNEIPRRRPDDLATAHARRGRFELDDTKPTQSLAEQYEEEHLKRTDPNHVDASNEKLQREHADIAALWAAVFARLDALSSWHYKPKPAAAALDIRVDAPTISLEDARPTAGAAVAGASSLAPQELYTPGAKGAATEIVTRAGVPVGREEMTREQKLRRRRRAKERIRKAGGQAHGSAQGPGESRKAQEKQRVVGELKKGGVRVIGKAGELKDVEGKAIAAGPAAKGAAAFML